MATLSDYLEDSRSLLRDELGIFTSTKQLTRWINQARRQAARRTGCLRVLITGQSAYGTSAQPGYFVPGGAIPGSLPGAVIGSGTTNLFQTITNQEMYSFQGFLNPFLRAQFRGHDQVTDAITVAVSWGGAYRPVQDWMPFEDYQAYVRSYQVLNSAFPVVWSTNGDGENQNLWLYPPPVQALEMEVDCFCVPTPLYTDNDYEALPASFAQAIKFATASLSYINSRPAQAAVMADRFADILGIGRFASDHGHTPSFYWGD